MFEKQQARDHMIIKFRDSTIKRFNTKEKVGSEEVANEIDSLKQENVLLREQIDQNPQTAKLFSEN